MAGKHLNKIYRKRKFLFNKKIKDEKKKKRCAYEGNFLKQMFPKKGFSSKKDQIIKPTKEEAEAEVEEVATDTIFVRIFILFNFFFYSLYIDVGIGNII